MRTMRFTRLMALAMALFAYVAVNAQEPFADMIIFDGTTMTDTVTGNSQFVPYYVEPDPVLNSGYSGPYDSAAANAGLTSSWVWRTVNSNESASFQGQGDDATKDGPYIQYSWTAPGGAPALDTIWVKEVAGFGCTGDSTYLEVYVVDPPSFTPIVADADDNDDYIEICEGAGTQNVILEQIGDNSVQGGNLKFKLDILVDSVDATLSLLGLDGAIRTSSDTIVTISEQGGDGVADTDVTLLPNYSMPVVDGQITRYRFDFSDADDGISDHISRKTDYQAWVAAGKPADNTAWNYVQASEDGGLGRTIEYIVYPAPNTGEIYYIPNDFDQ